MIRKTTGRRLAKSADPRADKRYDNPMLLLSLDGRCVYTLDWSFGGFKIAGVHAVLPVGQEVEGQIMGRIDGRNDQEVHFIGKVMNCDPAQRATHLRFVTLSDTAFTAMERALVRRAPELRS